MPVALALDLPIGAEIVRVERAAFLDRLLNLRPESEPIGDRYCIGDRLDTSRCRIPRTACLPIPPPWGFVRFVV